MTAIQNKVLQFKELGLMDYQTAFEYQENLMQSIIAQKLKNRDLTDNIFEETANYLLFVEHPHVYTLGKSGDEHNMLANSEKLKEILSKSVPSQPLGIPYCRS